MSFILYFKKSWKSKKNVTKNMEKNLNNSLIAQANLLKMILNQK